MYNGNISCQQILRHSPQFLDPDGTDTRDEPKPLYPDALKAAQELKSERKSFRVLADGDASNEQRLAFLELEALE